MYMYIIHKKIWKLIVFFTIYKVTDDNLLFFFSKRWKKIVNNSRKEVLCFVNKVF